LSKEAKYVINEMLRVGVSAKPNLRIEFYISKEYRD
jgi:hypothetical protein